MAMAMARKQILERPDRAGVPRSLPKSINVRTRCRSIEIGIQQGMGIPWIPDLVEHYRLCIMLHSALALGGSMPCTNEHMFGWRLFTEYSGRSRPRVTIMRSTPKYPGND